MEYSQSNHLKIAMAFSGGGYRSACFCLGVLSYLDRLKIGEKSILEYVTVLSTVSGGTITGTRYALGVKNGEDFTSIYRSLYMFMKEVDLVSDGLDRLLSSEGWDGRVKNLINAFADVYDNKLFNHSKFDTLLTDESPGSLKHLSFNATEFATPLQFRFQWSEKILNPKPGEPNRGIIGNKNFNIPVEAAKEIRLADIVAASSCFPGGFEPINFPTDFIGNESPNLTKLSQDKNYPIGLMDGGIVDNQGIDPILLAEERMKRNRETCKKGNELDLIILNDVASPYMEEFKSSVQRPLKSWRKLTPNWILTINTIILLTSITGLYWSLSLDLPILLIFCTVLITFTVVIYLLGRFLKKLPLRFNVPKSFFGPIGKLRALRLGVYENMVVNRKDSVLKMIGEVFLKHVRRLNYDTVYEDETWKNRRIMNAIYELRSCEELLLRKFHEGKLPGYLMPSCEIQEVAEIAASMGTTLWFTSDEIHKKNMMNSLIACGEFTACWNLLEYIFKAKGGEEKENMNNNHDELFKLEQQLRTDWDTFNHNPYWLVNERNSKLVDNP